MKKISLKISHQDKNHIFSFDFLQNLFDYFLKSRFFVLFFGLINICSLKALNFDF